MRSKVTGLDDTFSIAKYVVGSLVIELVYQQEQQLYRVDLAALDVIVVSIQYIISLAKLFHETHSQTHSNSHSSI